jgi:transcriptional regulator with GAF, ATPase, and Fis domain
LIHKSFQDNSPLVIRNKDRNVKINQVKAILCVPFEVGGMVQGVFYHDNAYVEDCFKIFSSDQLIYIAQALTSYVEHIISFSRSMDYKASEAIKELSKTDPVDIIAESAIMRRILVQADKAAEPSSNILILGETGVGKELLARRIHNKSPRKDRPLIVVDPTAIPETLTESELFGHEKGAFTGADNQKIGRLELAHKGTLFIDEVGEIPKAMQVKLLRALQEKTFIRIGGTKSITSDFRLIAATNRDLAEEVTAGRFREDLYFRLNVIPITLPPLRKRSGDILLIANYFLSMYTKKYNSPPLQLFSEQETMLLSHNWPGNVRELQNVMERAVLLSKEDKLNFSFQLEEKAYLADPFADEPTLDEMQRRYISYILSETNGKLSGPDGAAELLGMNYSTLYNRMKKLGLK